MKFNNVTPDIGERMLRTLLQLRAAQEGVNITDLVITKKESKGELKCQKKEALCANAI